jgi:hypothetical protein
LEATPIRARHPPPNWVITNERAQVERHAASPTVRKERSAQGNDSSAWGGWSIALTHRRAGSRTGNPRTRRPEHIDANTLESVQEPLAGISEYLGFGAELLGSLFMTAQGVSDLKKGRRSAEIVKAALA